jgi:hypothetical protein
MSSGYSRLWRLASSTSSTSLGVPSLCSQAQEPGNLSHRPSGDDQPEDLEFPGTEQLHRIFIAGELQDGDRVGDVRAQIELAGRDFFDGGGQNLGRIALGDIAASVQLHCALGEHGIVVHAEHQNAGIGFAADDAMLDPRLQVLK